MVIEKYYGLLKPYTYDTKLQSSITKNHLFDLYKNYSKGNSIKNKTERMKILIYLSNMEDVINASGIKDDIMNLKQFIQK